MHNSIYKNIMFNLAVKDQIFFELYKTISGFKTIWKENLNTYIIKCFWLQLGFAIRSEYTHKFRPYRQELLENNELY